MLRVRLLLTILATTGVLALRLATAVSGQIAVRNQGYVPFSEPPIDYRADVHDPVATLQARLDRNEVTLDYEPEHSYLKSLLAALAIPISSQSLVFSKTSFQYKHISPQSPRALYFNDDVYVGWVRGGKVLELVSFDATQGAIFYILDAQKAERPTFQRAELDCTTCHVASGTRGVPGVLIRSIHPNPTGTQAFRAPTFITGHQSPLKDRFGGWYVTGTHGRQTHMGNVLVEDREHPDQLNRAAGANVLDLSSRLDVSPYLSGHSDIVAQLVQAHQTQMHNLITLTNYQTRIALYAEAQRNAAEGRAANSLLSDTARKQFETPAEELVRYLLFTNEALLEDTVVGSSSFTKDFEARGSRDAHGRSLRDLDLQSRLFKYPCSYLIYSDAFDALPEPAKSYVYSRLLDVLAGRDQSADFARLTAADRRAIFEILLATKPGLPDAWKAHGVTRVMTTQKRMIQ